MPVFQQEPPVVAPGRLEGHMVRHVGCGRLECLGVLVTALAGFLIVPTTAARAELVVSTATKSPGVEVGAKFPDEQVFDLPAEAELRLLRTPSGAQFEMRGPFKGTLEQFNKDCAGWSAFTYPYCKSKSAGDQLPVGGTRGIRKPSN